MEANPALVIRGAALIQAHFTKSAPHMGALFFSKHDRFKIRAVEVGMGVARRAEKAQT